jgi:hypothetical protein
VSTACSAGAGAAAQWIIMVIRVRHPSQWIPGPRAAAAAAGFESQPEPRMTRMTRIRVIQVPGVRDRPSHPRPGRCSVDNLNLPGSASDSEA